MSSSAAAVPYGRASRHEQDGPRKRTVQKVLLQPIAILFKHLQERTPVSVWLYDRSDMRLEGMIVGFDEYMNVVLDSAVEVYSAAGGEPRTLGRIMLKGDNIALVRAKTDAN